MKKNRMMRLASVLLIMTLLSTSVISGTFAKYTTSASSNDSARVAVWGINADGVTMDLFDSSYETGNLTVNANDGDNLIAPGSTKTSNFSIINTSATLAPEVDYVVKIDLTGSEIDSRIKNNSNIVWKLDNNDWGTWDEMMDDILQLTGNTTANYEEGTTESAEQCYDSNVIATEFANGKTHSISWLWVFEDTTHDDKDSNGYDDQDEIDTAMGNEAVIVDIKAELVVKVTATQVD